MVVNPESGKDWGDHDKPEENFLKGLTKASSTGSGCFYCPNIS